MVFFNTMPYERYASVARYANLCAGQAIAFNHNWMHGVRNIGPDTEWLIGIVDAVITFDNIVSICEACRRDPKWLNNDTCKNINRYIENGIAYLQNESTIDQANKCDKLALAAKHMGYNSLSRTIGEMKVVN